MLQYPDLSNPVQKPKLQLAKPNRQIITNIPESYDINLKQQIIGTHELNFKVHFLIDHNHQLITNPHITQLKNRYLIKLTLGSYIEWFIIDNLSNNSDDNSDDNSDFLSIQCFSLEYELADRFIRNYHPVSILLSDVVSVALTDTIWSLGSYPSEYNSVYRAFDVASESVLSFILEIAEKYNLIAQFDTVNRHINFYTKDEIGENKGLVLSETKYLKNISDNLDNTKFCTRLKVYGKDEITIAKYNPTGKTYLEDYTYYLSPFTRDIDKNVLTHSDYWSDELCQAELDYQELVSSKVEDFNILRNQLTAYEETLSTQQSELNNLNAQLETVNNNVQTALSTNLNPEAFIIDGIPVNLYTLRTNLIGQITAKESDIMITLGNLDSTQSQINSLQDTLKLSTFFSPTLLAERNQFIIEKEITENAYVREMDLFGFALDKLAEMKIPPTQVKIGIVNFLECITEQHNWGKIVLGDTVVVKHSLLDINVSAQIIEADFNFENSDIQLTISDIVRIENEDQKLSRLFYRANTTGSLVDINKSEWTNALNNSQNYSDLQAQELNKALLNLAVNTNIVAGDGYITFAESQTLKTSLEQLKAESLDIINEANLLNITTEKTNYITALTDLETELNEWIDKEYYPIFISASQRTNESGTGINDLFQVVQNTKSILINKISSVRENNALARAANAQEVADGQIQGFFQPTAPTTGMAFGDIWIDTDGHTPPTTEDIYRYEDENKGSQGTLVWRSEPTNAIGIIYLNAYNAQQTANDALINNSLHIEYSADGINWHSVFNTETDIYMRQKIGDNGAWSSAIRISAVDGINGADGYTPVKGVDYFDGIDGQDGVNSYLWIRYSQNSNGNPMTADPTGAKYIGVATTTVSSAPIDYASYSWSLIKGTDGIPGEKGVDGKTSYLHIKYSNDGSTFTENNGETVGIWIGTYVDFNQTDSLTFDDYTWNKIRGNDGLNGADGVDGTSIVWKGTFASHPSNPQNGWAYKNSTDKKSYVYQSGTWYQMTIDGVNGINGADGLSIIWKGESSTPPSNPETNWVYRDTDNNMVYIYNGSSWELMVADGADGTNGTNGADGLSVFITYHDNTTDNTPLTPTGDGTLNGWHTAPTFTTNWMSQKVSSNVSSGTWGSPILISGGRRFVAQPTPPYNIGDLWLGGNNGDLMVCVNARETGNHVASDWTLATKYTDDTIANSKIKTFYQANIPTSTSIGDYWVDTDDNNHTYRANCVGANTIVTTGDGWYSIRDLGITRSSTTFIIADKSTTNNPSNADYIVPAGSTSAQVIINNAISDLPDNGGTILLLEGTYIIDGSIVLPSYTQLILSKQAIIKVKDNFEDDINMIVNSDINNGNTNIVISGMGILDGNFGPKLNNYIIYFRKVTFSNISDISEINSNGGGIYVVAGNNVNIVNTTCKNNNGDGIIISGLSNVFVGNNICTENRNGIQINSSENNTDIKIYNNNCQSNSWNGISCSYGCNISVNNNICNNNEEGGITVADSKNTVVNNNICIGNLKNGIDIHGNTITHQKTVDNIIVGNVSHQNGHNGIRIHYCDNSIITNNNCQANNQGGGISANILLNVGDYNNLQNNVCRVGSLTNKPYYGILINSTTCTGNIVTNNDLYDSGIAYNFSDAGTGTITSAGNRI